MKSTTCHIPICCRYIYLISCLTKVRLKLFHLNFYSKQMILSIWRVEWRIAFSLHFPVKFYSRKNLPPPPILFSHLPPSLSGATLRKSEFKCLKLSFFLLMQLCLGKYRRGNSLKMLKGEKITQDTNLLFIQYILLTKQDTYCLLLANCVGNAFYVFQHFDNFQ